MTLAWDHVPALSGDVTEAVEPAMGPGVALVLDQAFDMPRVLDLLACIPRARVRGHDLGATTHAHGLEVGHDGQRLTHERVRDGVVVAVERA